MMFHNECRPGVFIECAEGHVLPTVVVPENTLLIIGERLPLNCMFDIYFVTNAEGARVGFLFNSKFQVINGGSYLLTKLASKSKAEVAEVLIREEDLVVYNYPNKGTLAISPLVNSEIETILAEQ